MHQHKLNHGESDIFDAFKKTLKDFYENKN